MFGWKKGWKKVDDPKFESLTALLRPDLSRESLGVGPDFPGVAANPLLSPKAMRRNAQLRAGVLALGELVDWREVSAESSVRAVLMLDVDTEEGVAFRGIADTSLTITELTRLAPGQILPVRYRPTVMDHYVVLDRDADPADVQRVSDIIAARTRG